MQVDPKSTRLQLLTPFKAWHGDDIRDAAILIKVHSAILVDKGGGGGHTDNR